MFSKLRKGFVISGTACILVLICLSSETYWLYPFSKQPSSSYGPIEVNIEQRFYKTKNIVKRFGALSNESSQDITMHRDHINKKTRKSYPSFNNLETFLLFIGYPRSGSTLIGSLIDAHPNMAIANEYNIATKIFNYTTKQRTKKYICQELWKNSVKESQNQQRAATKKYFFHYHVPGLWQGKTKGPLKVIGDKKSTATTRMLGNKKFNVYGDLVSALNLPIKFIHIIRNPFDNIATMSLRAARSGLRGKAERTPGFQFDNIDILRKQKDIYLKLTSRITEIRDKHSNDILDIHYTDFLKRPAFHIERICKFIGVTCDEDYIRACVQIIFKTETYTRRYVKWYDDVKYDIYDAIKNIDYLNDYKFEIT